MTGIESSDAARREQAELQARLAAIVESSHDAIIGKTLDGVITSWNPAAERLYGYAASEVIGQSISLLVPPDRPDELPTILRRLERGERIENFETVRVRRDGSRVDVSLSVSPIRTADGGILGAATIAREASERQRAQEAALIHEQAARVEAERLHQRSAFLAEAGSLLAASLDYETTLQDVARLAVPRIADWCVVDVMGDGQTLERLAVAHVDPAKVALAQDLERRYPADPAAPSGVHEVLRTGRAELYPEIPDELLTASAQDAEHLRLIREVGIRSAILVPLEARGRRLGVISLVTAESGRRYGVEDLALAEELAQRAAIAVDNADLYRQAQEEIAARQRAEEERAQLLAREELARTKNELLSVVSHELRTPLASLVGFAELLLARSYPEQQQKQFLQVMLDEGRRLTRLINDFLDLQRLESGIQRIQPRATAVSALLERAMTSAGDEPACPISLDVASDLPPVMADEDRMQQVLANLLSNARKYSPAGGDIRLAARLAGNAVEVSVQDRGLGIPPEALPRMFEKFFRVDNSDRRDIKGTGLGLAVVKNLVETHGGRIWAESAGLGNGSTFRFTLPIAEAAAESWPTTAAAETVPGGGDVVLVEDDPAFASWLTEALRGEGYTVRPAASAEAALHLIGQARPGVVLLDLRLDGPLDGWDLLAVLRGRPGLQDLPVVIVSGYEERDRGQALGVSDYFLKPVGMERLVAVLRHAGVAPGRTVLVIEDEPTMQQTLLETLREAGMQARAVGSGEEALAALDAEPAAYELLLLDLGLPGMDGLAVLDAVRARPDTRDLPVVVLTALDLDPEQKRRLTEQAVRVLRKGNGIPIAEAIRRALRPLAAERPGPRE